MTCNIFFFNVVRFPNTVKSKFSSYLFEEEGGGREINENNRYN